MDTKKFNYCTLFPLLAKHGPDTLAFPQPGERSTLEERLTLQQHVTRAEARALVELQAEFQRRLDVKLQYSHSAMSERRKKIRDDFAHHSMDNAEFGKRLREVDAEIRNSQELRTNADKQLEAWAKEHIPKLVVPILRRVLWSVDRMVLYNRYLELVAWLSIGRKPEELYDGPFILEIVKIAAQIRSDIRRHDQMGDPPNRCLSAICTWDSLCAYAAEPDQPGDCPPEGMVNADDPITL